MSAPQQPGVSSKGAGPEPRPLAAGGGTTPAFVARERDAAVRQVRELMAARSRSEEQLQLIRVEAAAVTAQRDAALVCIENLMQEATALAEDLKESQADAVELKQERDQLLAKVVELSQQIAQYQERRVVEPEPSRPAAAILNPQTGDTLRYADFASTVALSAFSAADEFDSLGEHLAPPSTDYFHTAADEFFAKVGDEAEEPALFLLQKGVPAIEYEAVDDVLELHHSVNFAYLSAEGKEQESCQGYVCCVKRQGTVQVFAALCGIHSGKTWVYGPEHQGTDDASCTKLLRDALKFAEEVGFLMERVLPGPKPPQQRAAIARCPVLKPVAGPRGTLPAPQDRV
ncbi:coiled-coil domain-containing protein [Geomesophilobacter sediminis]|uniref:Uncharacterized protein n=1 Tax=Geomesophilobacter sediminis TaxID=2798584 RepID=A0A8J7S8X5_9BACT|nr:hypothetical protein [Geomesophilobacter sediminis]MBJ6727916.1 hypothetical protein [Geomesophilobacter sediminis]